MCQVVDLIWKLDNKRGAHTFSALSTRMLRAHPCVDPPILGQPYVELMLRSPLLSPHVPAALLRRPVGMSAGRRAAQARHSNECEEDGRDSERGHAGRSDPGRFDGSVQHGQQNAPRRGDKGALLCAEIKMFALREIADDGWSPVVDCR